MDKPIARYKCPDCGDYFEPPNVHQHANGEWVKAEDLRKFHQTTRWVKMLTEDPNSNITPSGKTINLQVSKAELDLIRHCYDRWMTDFSDTFKAKGSNLGLCLWRAEHPDEKE